MATYVLPQVLVFQDFRLVPSAAANPLRAHITGPHAFLRRYAEDDERDRVRLGYYDRLLDTSYAWPDRPAGGIVDPTYTKLWMKDALLQYFEDTIASGSVITKTAGYNNRVRSATVSFAENGDYPRAGALLDRDVRPGDVAKVRGIDGDGAPVTLWTSVKDLVGDPVAATIDAATYDDNNPASQSANVAITQTAGADNCVRLEIDDSAYDGLPSGYIDETYDFVVTESSAGGAYPTATLRVLSASGEDDETNLNPAAEGEWFDVGARGLRARFVTLSGASCSTNAGEAEVSPTDLIAGQRFRAVVQDGFTRPVPTEGGTYTGTNDTTYIINVIRGGLYTDATPPLISVTTTTGVDLGGPETVTGAGVDVDVGTLGVTVSFTGNGLRKGDKYYIAVTAEAEGPMRTVVLAHNLDTTIADGSQVDLTLFIRNPLLEIGEDRTGFAPEVNWEQSETEFTAKAGIVAYDSTWTDDGVPQALDVYSAEDAEYGILYVEYRAWLADLCNEVNGIRDPGEINDLISGALHPDNPLKWGVFKALENSNGTEVKFSAVCDPDKDESWADVLDLINGRDDVYELVPLTTRRTVQDLWAAHVKALSAPEQGLWRVTWFALTGVPEVPVVSAGSTVPGHTEATTDDGEACLCVIEDDPLTSGSQYTILRCTSGNGNFLTNGVRAGDVVRTLYTGDGFGNYVYSEFVVDEVQAEDQIRLLAGPDAPVSVSQKTEVWRNLTATEEAAAIAQDAGSWGDRRIRAVWPDRIEASGTVMDGYFLCAALAGLASGVLPHQGLTNLEIVGFSDVPRTTRKFSRTQLDAMAVAGTWIVTQDVITGKVFTRHAVTTAEYDDINQREEMLTRNVDSISYRFKDWFRPFIGVTNVTPVIERQLRTETANLIEVLKTEGFTTRLGPQLVDATIVRLSPSIAFKDRYVLVLDLEIPYPFNNFEIHLVA